MWFESFVRKTIEFIFDIFRIKVVRYLMLLMLASFIIGLIFSPKEGDVYRSIEFKKNVDIKRFEVQNEISWEQYSKIYSNIKVKIEDIVIRGGSSDDNNKKIKEFFVGKFEDYEIDVQKIEKIKDNQYSSFIKINKWIRQKGRDGALEPYGSFRLIITDDGEKTEIEQISDIEKN
ncbi:MAG TPA: hypothetical protein DCP90_00210 [Clostridiales bacterium]|nr:MAG: hypothetical protein A2Y22_04410 [Clostridiales bacterium GWD2_32_59]HAN09018.1 hypothetical protein [Clostridiales bacterium]